MKIEKLTFQIYLTEKRLNLWTSQIFLFIGIFTRLDIEKQCEAKSTSLSKCKNIRKQSKFCGIKWNNKTANNWNEKWILIWLFGNDNKRTQYNNCIPSLLQGAPLEITMIEPKQSVRLSSAVRGSEVQHLTFGVNASMGNKDGWRLLLLNWKSKQNAWRSNNKIKPRLRNAKIVSKMDLKQMRVN